jgi:DNA-binding transcriptional MocR family regulator
VILFQLIHSTRPTFAVSSGTQESSSWTPNVAASGGSFAQRLADAIGADIASGALAPGNQLPTQRELARRLDVAVGTVNRAYAIAERLGLVSPEVGRGTFVGPQSGVRLHDVRVSRRAGSAIELGLNYPDAADAEDALRDTLPRLVRDGVPADMLALAPYAGTPAHRAAGARLLERFGVDASADSTMLCTSVQHGLAASLGALAVPGDVILTESLTSPGMKALAAAHHLRLVPVDCDGDGLDPEALVSASRATSARVVYTMPTLHTPTTRTMPNERRHRVAAVLKEHDLIAIEDDAWGFLAQGEVTPLAALAPDAVVYVTSVSKSLAPGLRVGYVVAPTQLRRAIASSIGSMTWAAPLLAEIVSRWIHDGTAAALIEKRIARAAERQRLLKTVLGEVAAPTEFPAFHAWIPLPEPWRVEDFVAHAGVLGVSLVGSETFVPGRSPAPHNIRVCIGTERDADRVERGLRVIAEMLRSGPTAFSIPRA